MSEERKELVIGWTYSSDNSIRLKERFSCCQIGFAEAADFVRGLEREEKEGGYNFRISAQIERVVSTPCEFVRDEAGTCSGFVLLGGC